jgi:hypothetical protein
VPGPIGPRPTVLPISTGGTTGPTNVTGPAPVMPVEPTTPGAPVPSGGTVPSGSGSGFVAKARTKIVERTWKELTSSHTLTLASLSLGDHGNLAVRLKERLHRATDASITGDTHKSATTAKLAAETGKTVLWAETGGLVEPTAALSTSIPTAGVVNVNVGFSTSGLLEYRAMHPVTVSGSGVIDVLKEHTIDMPTDADKARALEPGVEVELLGRGSASLSAGVSAGLSHAMGHLTAGVSAGVSASTTRTGTWAVKVARLDGDKVRVQLSEIQERSRQAGVSVNAGLTLDGRGLIDETLGGTLNSSTESVDLENITGGNAGSSERVADRVVREGAKVLEKAVRSYTAFHASAGTSASEKRTDIQSYVLDLSTPDGKRAYDRLIKLDESTASSLAGRPGVSRHTYNEVQTTTTTGGRVTFAGAKLVLANALRQETSGTLSTANGTTLIRTSVAERNYSGIITGKKNIKWEGVTVTERQGAAPQHFFHMRFTNKDKVTRDHEVTNFVRFADALGAKDASERNITLPSTWLLGRVFSSADDTDVSADIYFSDQGVRDIAHATTAQIHAAVGDAHAAIVPERKGAPLSDPRARGIAAEYHRIDREIDREFDQSRKQDLERDKHWQSVEYKRATGRKLDVDAPAFADAVLLEENASKMGTTGTEEGWSKVFADIGEKKRFDYMPIIVALSALAGREDTLVHEVSIKGQGINLRSIDEGALVDPSVHVNHGIGGHGV